MYCLYCEKDSLGDSSACSFCGKDIASYYQAKARDYVQDMYVRSPSFASLTTAPGFHVDYAGQPKLYFAVSDPQQIQAEVEKVLWTRPNLPSDAFTRFENPIREKIVDARRILVDRVLPLGAAATTHDKSNVILFMGAALDIQVGKDTLIFDQKTSAWIQNRLNLLQVPDNFRADFDSVREYYNATKHGDRPEHIELLRKIGSAEGRIIAAQYFEYVRRILEWYYREQGAPSAPELQTINFASFGISF